MPKVDNIPKIDISLLGSYPENWSVMTLQQACKQVTDGTHDSPKPTDVGYPLVTGKCIKDDKINFNIAYKISKEDHLEVMKRSRPERGDLLFANIGNSIGDLVLVDTDKEFSIKNIALLKPAECLRSYYLKYWMKSPQFQKFIKGVLLGSAQPFLGLSTMRSLPIAVPSLKIQDKIIGILKPIDDKIELNNQMNETLEAMARAIFKEWFIDFGPVRAKAEGRRPFGMDDETAALFPDSFEESELGMIPKGWRVVPIKDELVHFIGGGWGQDKPTDKEALGAFVIRGTDMPDIELGEIKSVPYRFHKESTFSSRKLEDFDIVFEVSGGSEKYPLGRHLLLWEGVLRRFGKPSICASFCKLIRPRNKFVGSYLSFYLFDCYKKDGFNPYIVQSTGLSNFKFTDFSESFCVLMPTNDLLNKFFNTIKPLYEKRVQVGEENCMLTNCRDMLLPRLISGEIEL